MKPGDVAQLKSGAPSFVVIRVADQQVEGRYYNPVTGHHVSCSVYVECVRLVAEQGSKK